MAFVPAAPPPPRGVAAAAATACPAAAAAPSAFLGRAMRCPGRRARGSSSSSGGGRKDDGSAVAAPRHQPPTSNISTNDFRPGTTIEMDGTVYRVIEFQHVKPGKGAAFVRTKLKNLKAGSTVEKTFKAGENVAQAQLEKVQMQHTYVDGDDLVFMNMETYEEERLSRAVLGDRICNYLMEGLEVEVLKHNEDVLGVEIPKSMILTVAQTDPGVKGNTVQGGTKPATLESGAVIQVPLFINEGEKIVVNTEENKYVSRYNA
jgi:elongation factor P